MDAEAFRRHGHDLVDWIAGLPEPHRALPGPLEERAGCGARRVAVVPADRGRPLRCDLPRLRAGDPARHHPLEPPGASSPTSPSPGAAAGVLAEFLSAALNVQAMLWRTSPAATEARRGDAWLAAAASSACPTRSKASSTTPRPSRACTRWPRPRHRAVADVAPAGLARTSDLGPLRVYGLRAGAFVDRQGDHDARGWATTRCPISPRTTSSGCGPRLCARPSPPTARGA